jgi:hypothetical protein
MSEQDVDQALDQAQAPDPLEQAGYGFNAAGPCPVKPLGHRGGVYFYLSPRGELRHLTAREHNKLGVASLFEGDLEWCRVAAPAYDRDGSPRPGSWSPDGVAFYLMRSCAREGVYDASLPVRGPGVWRTREGAPLVHCGDQLAIEGVWQPSGIKRAEALYPAAARIPQPAEAEAEKAVGRDLLGEMRRLWAFETDVEADFVFGWMGAALLGAFPRWRPHIYVIGERGSGKTWLAELVAAALGGQAHASMNNYTEAGLRQALTGEARALVLDESEHDESSRVQAVIELLRHMSSGEGARAVRGSAGGSAQTFTVNGCAYLSSILHVPMKPQDRSRIAVVRLAALRGGADAADRAERARALLAKAVEASPALRARALARAHLFEQLFEVYRRAFTERGCDARQADQFGTLLAGRDILTQDDLPEGAALAGEVDRFGDQIDQARSADEEDSEGALCLTRLLTSRVDHWRGGERPTVSQVLMSALQETGTEARETLGQLGLLVERSPGPGGTFDRLFVANNHEALAAIFAGSRWERGAWSQALRYLEGAEPADRKRFAGVRSRATLIPASHLPVKRDDAG